MAKCLITGVTGFVGSHMAEYLLSKGQDVYGGARWRAPLDNVAPFYNLIHISDLDIRDSTNVWNLLREIKPDYIFHLAAQSFVPASFSAPGETMFTNVIGTLNILEAVRKLNLDTIVQIAGSSEEYGMVYREETPIKEENQLRPLSPYGVSKVTCDMLAQQYNRSYGVRTIITRAFNHEGERRGKVFVTSNFANQIAKIEQGLQEPVIKVGNLDAYRDFTDVHDMVDAYWHAAIEGEFGTPYNICSGKAWRIGDMLDYLISLSTVKGIKIEYDQSRARPSDVPLLLGDYTKFHNATGWEPKIPFENTLGRILKYWREHDLRKPVKTEA